jgi:hypothetical protein
MNNEKIKPVLAVKVVCSRKILLKFTINQEVICLARFFGAHNLHILQHSNIQGEKIRASTCSSI